MGNLNGCHKVTTLLYNCRGVLNALYAFKGQCNWVVWVYPLSHANHIASEGTTWRNKMTKSISKPSPCHHQCTQFSDNAQAVAACAAPIASRDVLRERRKLSKEGGRYRLWRYATKRKRQNKNKNNNTTNLLLGGNRREGIRQLLYLKCKLLLQ